MISKRKSKFVVMALCCMTGLTMTSCSEQEKTVAVKASEVKVNNSIQLKRSQLSLLNLDFQKIEEKIIYPTIFASGIIAPKPNNEASVTPRIGGMVDEIFVLEGSTIRKGQAIMRISSTELIQMQQDYMAAVIDVLFHQKEFERQTKLKNSNVSALAEYQLAENKYLSAVSLEKTLAEKLKIQGINPDDVKDPSSATLKSDKIIRSPIDGFLFKLHANVGMRADQGTVLAQIINLSELRADIYCYEKDLALIEENQELELQFINKNIPPTKGRIDHISRSIDRDTRSIVMHTSFKTPKGFLIMPEMSVTAKIRGLGSGKMAKTIPQTAVYDEGEQLFIFYTESSLTDSVIVIKKAKINIGNTDGKSVELIPEENIPTNVSIATSNVYNIASEFKKKE